MDALLFPFATALGGAAAFAHGTWYRNSALFGRVLHRLPGDARRVALTFDDGPNAVATPLVLDALAALDVRATFFVLGSAARRHPSLVRRLVAEGHEVGNHGWSHRKLHFVAPRVVREEIARGTAAIAEACGVRPRFFRAPHGFRSPWVNAIASEFDQQVVGWSLGVWDSDRPGVSAIVARTLRGVRPGAIVLLHDGDGDDPDGDRRQTATAISRIVEELRARGYAFALLPP